MNAHLKYEFKAKTWQYASPGGWYFVSLPIEISKEIRSHSKSFEEGWGRLKVNAFIRKTEWKTAIWFDTKSKRYLLPLKSEIRKKEGIENNQEIEIKILI